LARCAKGLFRAKTGTFRGGVVRFSTTGADYPHEWQEAVNQLSAIL
jgi:hypothetical protein